MRLHVFASRFKVAWYDLPSRYLVLPVEIGFVACQIGVYLKIVSAAFNKPFGGLKPINLAVFKLMAICLGSSNT